MFCFRELPSTLSRQAIAISAEVTSNCGLRPPNRLSSGIVVVRQDTTVDGSEILHQLRLVVFSQFKIN